MGNKWGSNEGIRVGDIFECLCGPYLGDPDSDYYQVAALRGRTQVALRPLRTERYINEGIEGDSPLSLFRERTRPLPGQFLTADDVSARVRYERGREIRRTGLEVTAWVLPNRTVEGRVQLQEVRWGSGFSQSFPEDWAPWNAETIRQMEEKTLQEREDYARRLMGEEGYAKFCADRAGTPGKSEEE